jgi:hemerythrin-like domain-containing protein
MELTTNGVVITDAIKYVQGKMDHLNKTEKALLQDIKEKEDQSNEPSETQEDEEETQTEEKTTNGIF